MVLLKPCVTWSYRWHLISFNSLHFVSSLLCSIRLRDSWEIQCPWGTANTGVQFIWFDPNAHLDRCPSEVLARLIVSTRKWYEHSDQTDVLRSTWFVVCVDYHWAAAKTSLKPTNGPTICTWISNTYRFGLTMIWPVWLRLPEELERHVTVQHKLCQKPTLERDKRLSEQK